MALSLPVPVARLAPLLLCSLLAACATVGPDYHPPVAQAPAAWQAVPLEGTVPAGDIDLSRWWTQLADPQLSRLVDEALVANPDLQRAAAALRAARAARELAVANRFPTLSASAGASRSTALGVSRSLYQAGFDAAWEPDVFGGTRRALEAAEADLAASEADLQATRVSLVAEVALNYVELRAYQARLAIARDNLASQTETAQITDWRSQAGLASSLEVEQARSNRDSTRAAIPALDSGRAGAEHRLAILTGRTPGSLHAVLAVDEGTRGRALPSLPPGIALSIPAEVLRQRPDVQAAERRLAAETARIGQAEAARYPAFSLSGNLGLEALGLSVLGGGGQIARSLAAGVSGPLFDAGRARARVQAQEAVRDQSRAAYEATVLTALEEVQNALVALANGRERQQALSSAAGAARNAALLARHRYTSGLIDFQTVLTTERSLLSIEDSLASAEAERVTALIQLYKALGGGWSPRDTAMNARVSPPAV
ncbi:efflux transporter outer membrane subunit [Zoogloea dura]|jgi:multidrug efflux system outer membrane protein|uniref:Efflux transporter outer membrane subunit n=1 Tax=Zoogloea dura TaxID=2728840 RepID=A0A848G3S8_9RHOO|nr:efflux transporter outer membrane subunit [Zoogloea dura]NML25635.1 efflux transporter outer membrane subunit [Zoogloea dura]